VATPSPRGSHPQHFLFFFFKIKLLKKYFMVMWQKDSRDIIGMTHFKFAKS